MLENTSVSAPAAVWQLLSITSRGIGSARLSRSARSEAPTSCLRPCSPTNAITPSPRSRSNPPCPMKWNTWQPAYIASCAASQFCPATQSTAMSPRACKGASSRCSRRCSLSASKAARSPRQRGHPQYPQRRGHGQRADRLGRVDVAHHCATTAQIAAVVVAEQQLPRQNRQLWRAAAAARSAAWPRPALPRCGWIGTAPPAGP